MVLVLKKQKKILNRPFLFLNGIDSISNLYSMEGNTVRLENAMVLDVEFAKIVTLKEKNQSRLKKLKYSYMMLRTLRYNSIL